MKEEKKEKLKQKLVNMELMDPNDSIVDCLQASYKERLLGKVTSGWKQGWIYFTEERIVYPTGIFDTNIVIPYSKIKRLEKKSQFFLPLGIDVTYEENESGKVVTQKFSMQKRNDWIEFIAKKAGISVS